jgi:hypothetical protein
MLNYTVLCSWSNIQHGGGNIYSYYTRKPGGGNWEGNLTLFRLYIREVAFGTALAKDYLLLIMFPDNLI